MANRVTQVGREALEGPGNPNARLTQLGREALQGPGVPKARLTQIGVEALQRVRLTPLNRSPWVVTPSRTQSGFPASNMTDGNTGTWWQSGPGGLPVIITINLGSAQNIGYVSVQPATSDAVDTPTQIIISISSNGVTFTQVGTGTGPGDSTPIVVTFAPVTTQYVQTTVTQTPSGTGAQVAEINAGTIAGTDTFNPPTGGPTLALVPVDNIAGQKVQPWWNQAWGAGSGSQSSIYTGTNFPGSGFGGAYPYNGAVYAFTGDALFASAPSNVGPSLWKSTDGVNWTQQSNPPFTSNLDWRNGWVVAWNPLSVPNIITFCGYSFANLVDFNLDTLTWGSIYATNAPLAGHNRAIARLSDGRVRFIGADDTDGHLYYSTANTSGSGVWDTWATLIQAAPYTGSFNLDQGGAALDQSNRMHVWWRYSQGASVSTTYANVDTTNTVTVQTGSVIDQTKATGAMLAADNVYVGAIGVSAANSIDVYVGVGLSNPVWHTEQVAVGTFPPDHLFLQVLNGLVTLGWQEQDAAHVTPMKIKVAQRNGGAWSTPQTILDLALIQPVVPFLATAPVWIGEGFSFYPNPQAFNGIGLLSALDITTTPKGTFGTMTFTVGGTGPSGPPSTLWLMPFYPLPEPCVYPKHQRGKNLLTLKTPQYFFKKKRV